MKNFIHNEKVKASFDLFHLMKIFFDNFNMKNWTNQNYDEFVKNFHNETKIDFHETFM